MKHLKLFENYDEDSNEIYFYIEDGSKKAVVRLIKSDGKWTEHLVRGTEPYGFGGKKYQSYLKPNDILSWLRKDYKNVTMIEAGDIDDYLEENAEPSVSFYIFDKEEFSQAGDFTGMNAKGEIFDIFADGTVTSQGTLKSMGMTADEFFEDAEGPIEMDELPSEIRDIVEDDVRFK